MGEELTFGARVFHRLFALFISRRLFSVPLVLLFTVGLGFFATRVRPDYSVENLFPVWSDSRTLYNEYKQRYPYEDTRAVVVVEAADLWTREGLLRLSRLEDDLAKVPNVVDVEGPMTVKDVVGFEGGVRMDRLVPSADLTPEELAEKKHLATTDPLFRWNLAAPDGSSVSIRLTVDHVVAASDEGRQVFRKNALAALERHQHPGQKVVLSGIPAIRATFAEMIGQDLGRLLPSALVVVLALLFLAFRSPGGVVAGFLGIVASLVWSYGAMGLMGFPLTMLASLMPIILIIISISDTVHIVNDFTAKRRAQVPVKEAVLEAIRETAVPCLTTELVLAAGFLTLTATNITAVVQLGLATAAGMLLTWLANVTVVPLALSFTRKGAARPEPTWALTAFARLVKWIEAQVTLRPRRVVLVAVVILGGFGAFTPMVQKLSFAFDDLRPESGPAKDIAAAEAAHGGLVPLALYIEVEGDDAPALSPEAVALADRAAQFLRQQTDYVGQANSLADYLRKTHRLLLGEDWKPEDPDLPQTKSLLTQELLMIDDGKVLRDLVSSDRKTLAAFASVKDVGSKKTEELYRRIDAFLAKERSALAERKSGPRITIRPTGQLSVFKDVNDLLLEGLFLSFGGSLVVSFLVMCVLLRSWRLGLIGLIPNLAPLLLVFGFMTLLGVNLKPTTVVLFSITLVIAEDDTIQYLSRFRTHYRAARKRGSPHPDKDAAIECLGDVGLPMFITTTSVTAGFLLFLFSNFLGLAHLGALIGATLFAAVFADLFLNPILLMKLRPLRGLKLDGHEPAAPKGG